MFWYLRGMDVFLTDLQDRSEHVNPGARVTALCVHAPGLGARVEVSRARALVSFPLAKTLTAPNPASKSGLMAAEGRRNGTIERTVPTREYVRWTMFDQTFISAGPRPGGAHGVGGARRRAWVVSPARVIVLMGFRRDRIGVV